MDTRWNMSGMREGMGFIQVLSAGLIDVSLSVVI